MQCCTYVPKRVTRSHTVGGRDLTKTAVAHPPYGSRLRSLLSGMFRAVNQVFMGMRGRSLGWAAALMMNSREITPTPPQH